MLEAEATTPPPRARARGEEAGGALRRSGRLDEARELLDEAVATYEALGASRDVARSEAALRQLGIRRGRRGPRGRPQTGWEGLTDKEARIADLVADGLSNPQIAERMLIARHTVHTHVSHILTKLALSSRGVELAREAVRRRV